MIRRYVAAAEHVLYLPVLEGPEHALYVSWGTIVCSIDVQVRHDAELIARQKRHDLPVATRQLIWNRHGDRRLDVIAENELAGSGIAEQLAAHLVVHVASLSNSNRNQIKN